MRLLGTVSQFINSSKLYPLSYKSPKAWRFLAVFLAVLGGFLCGCGFCMNRQETAKCLAVCLKNKGTAKKSAWRLLGGTPGGSKRQEKRLALVLKNHQTAKCLAVVWWLAWRLYLYQWHGDFTAKHLAVYS